MKVYLLNSIGQIARSRVMIQMTQKTIFMASMASVSKPLLPLLGRDHSGGNSNWPTIRTVKLEKQDRDVLSGERLGEVMPRRYSPALTPARTKNLECASSTDRLVILVHCLKPEQLSCHDDFLITRL